MEFCKKAEFHLLAAFFVGLGKNLWCDMSPVFSGNFLIASFSQETPCQKFKAHISKWDDKGLHHIQVHDGTAFWKSFVGVEQIKW